MFTMFCIKTMAFDITINGHVYYKHSDIKVPYQTIHYSVNNDSVYDKVVTDYDGFYTIVFEGNPDVINKVNFYPEDCLEKGDSAGFIEYYVTYVDNYLPINICAEYNNPCLIGFVYDTIAEQTVKFIDTSQLEIDTWYWDFGDGNYSFEQHPEHFYFAPGLYNITLIAGITDSSECEISDTVEVPVSDFLYGEAYTNMGLLDSGIVYSYNHDMVYDTFGIESNNFNGINSFENNRFKIKREEDATGFMQVVPTFDVHENHLPVYFPTYYGGSFYWEDSRYYYLGKKDSLNITLIKRDELFFGHGSISGTISIPEYYEVNADRVCVFLLDKDAKKPLKYAYLENGYSFTFNNVEMGNYYLLVDAVGVPVNPMRIELKKEQPNKSVDYILGNGSYTEINVAKQKSDIKVYPNPFKNNLIIKLPLNGITPVQILNSEGAMVFDQTFQCSSNYIELNLHFLKEGFYIIKTPTESVKVYKVN